MIIFTFSAGLLVFFTLIIILFPLFKNNSSSNIATHKTLYKKRLAELNQDKKNLFLSDSEYDARLAELQTQLLYDDEHKADAFTNSQRTSAITLISISALVLISSSLIYLWIGTGKVGMLKFIPTSEDLAEIDADTIRALEDRIKKENNTAVMWHQLGTMYFEREAYEDSQRVFKTAIDMQSDNSMYFSDYAEALIMLNNKIVSAEAFIHLEKALNLDQKNPKALWLVALHYSQNNDSQNQLIYLTRLRSLLEPTDQIYAQITNIIEGISTQTQETSKTDSSAEITANINIDDALREKISGEDIVFVYAKAISGPPMPLAVAKYAFSDLPKTIVLNDQMAMMPNMIISDHEEVEVSVLISKSGKIGINQGDLKGSVKPVSTKAGTKVSITVDTIIP